MQFNFLLCVFHCWFCGTVLIHWLILLFFHSTKQSFAFGQAKVCDCILLTTFSLGSVPPVSTKTFSCAEGSIHLQLVTSLRLIGSLTSFREAVMIENFRRKHCMAICKDTLRQRKTWLKNESENNLSVYFHWPHWLFLAKMWVLTFKTLYRLGSGSLKDLLLPYNLTCPLRSSGEAFTCAAIDRGEWDGSEE